MNNNNLIQAQKWLTELGIRTEPACDCLGVNRKDVLELVGGPTNEAPLILLIELKKAVSTKLFWGGVSDNPQWYYLESF
jgi:hypothetical protein